MAKTGWPGLPDQGKPALAKGNAEISESLALGRPSRGLALYVQDEVFDLKRKLVGVAIRTSASVREALHAAFLITIEDLIAGLAGDALRPLSLTLQINLSLVYREPRVVERVVFIFRAVVGDALHDFLRVVAAGEGAFRIRPITFRLAAVSGGRMTSGAVAYVPRSRG
jgi:hypothetical protein